jgi:hypothetical protein
MESLPHAESIGTDGRLRDCDDIDGICGEI